MGQKKIQIIKRSVLWTAPGPRALRTGPVRARKAHGPRLRPQLTNPPPGLYGPTGLRPLRAHGPGLRAYRPRAQSGHDMDGAREERTTMTMMMMMMVMMMMMLMMMMMMLMLMMMMMVMVMMMMMMLMMMMMMQGHAASGAKPFPAYEASQSSASEARCQPDN